MTQEIEKHKQVANNRSFFDYATEVIGWLQIVPSPLLFALLIAVCVYLYTPTTTGLVLALV